MLTNIFIIGLKGLKGFFLYHRINRIRRIWFFACAKHSCPKGFIQAGF